MGPPNASWEGHMGPPELDRQTDWQTRLKTLPSCTLRMRVVKSKENNWNCIIMLFLNYKPKFNLQIERVNILCSSLLWGGGYPAWLIQGGTLLGSSGGGGVLFCDHFWGGVLFHDHFWGGTLLVSSRGYPAWSIWGGYPAWSIQRGGPLLWPLPCDHFHDHFWGGPMWPIPWFIWCYLFALQTPTDGSGLMQLLIYTAAPVHHGKVTWDPPRVGQTDWQTNTTENITFPHTTYAGGN